MRSLRAWSAMITVALGACGGGSDGDCTLLADGPWTMDGSCFGMAMAAAVTVDAEACSFTFSDWNMAMSVPDGGTVSGDEVTLTGADWSGCTGTTDGATVSGTCADGCTFDMAAE